MCDRALRYFVEAMRLDGQSYQLLATVASEFPKVALGARGQLKRFGKSQRD